MRISHGLKIIKADKIYTIWAERPESLDNSVCTGIYSIVNTEIAGFGSKLEKRRNKGQPLTPRDEGCLDLAHSLCGNQSGRLDAYVCLAISLDFLISQEPSATDWVINDFIVRRTVLDTDIHLSARGYKENNINYLPVP